jgi:type I restriction enzyme S subunit
MREIPFIIPPFVEQAAIVRYLDHVDRRIRRYIRAKRKLIKLLEEQRQAVIDLAVTRGLDPSVRFKTSGVEWLGNVPEHWQATRLKHVAEIQTGITLGKTYGDTTLVERPYLRVANVQEGRIDLTKVTTVRVPEREATGATLQIGDVLMTEGGDIDKLGRGCVWHGEVPNCLHQNHVFAVRPVLHELLPQFLVVLMASSQGRSYFQITAKQTTNLAATNSSTLGGFPLFLPDVREQHLLLHWIAEHTEGLVSAIERATRGIALFREYRTRLIADVVTGKLDVREAAARLPGEGDDSDPLDHMEAEGDAEDPDAGIVPEEAEA